MESVHYDSLDDRGLAGMVALLKSETDRHVGASELGGVLGVDPGTVEERIRELEGLGYRLEFRRGRGYRLAGTTALPLPWEVAENLGTKLLGQRIHFFDSIKSTQDHALGIAAAGTESGTLVIAGEQTGGRGRRGRAWVSPRGGVWISVILPSGIDAQAATLLPAAASVALSRAMWRALKVKTKLKWPNDVMLGDRKVAGIIVDAEMLSGRLCSAVLGVGVNIGVDAGEIEGALGAGNRPGVASVAGAPAGSGTRLIRRFLVELEDVVHALLGGRTESIVRAWTRRSSTIGRVVSAGGNRGTAVRLDVDGALVLRCGSRTLRVVADDIHP